MLVVNQITDTDKIRKLPWLIAASLCNSIFVVLTFMGSVFILFLNELGLDESRIGVVVSLIPFCQVVGIFTATWGARYGFKKIFLIFHGIRKIVILFILATPLIVKYFGTEGAYLWVVAVIFIFSLMRSVSETAFLPWVQEIVPNNIRGKINAVNNIIATAGMMLTIVIAGYIIDSFSGLGRFISLMSGGIFLGIISIFLYSYLPGGSPVNIEKTGHVSFAAMFRSFKDRNYCLFLAGLGFATVALGAIVPFIPLYLKQQIGIAAGQVVWIDLATMVGSLLACFIWGWACDRYGSKPVMLTGLGMVAILPVLWFIMPRESAYSVSSALVIAFIFGIANIGWALGFSQYLYVSAVPVEKRSSYLPVFYSLTGVLGAAAPLLAGWILSAFKPFGLSLLIFNLDAYSIIFCFGFIMLLVAIFIISRVSPDGAVTTHEFVGMMFQRNPILALSNNVRYHWAGNETNRVRITERMGSAKTLLSSEELIEALGDPSFNVRHEAITAIAKMPAHPKLVDALILILGGNEPDLALTAAWALGKLGNKTAIIALRETLLSKHPLLQARSARALAMLDDQQSKGFIMDKLHNEQDEGLKVAYASALGALKTEEALEPILTLLRTVKDEGTRNEIVLAVVRIISAEHQYIRLFRNFTKDRITSSARLLFTIRRHLNFPTPQIREMRQSIEDCANLLAADQWDDGIKILCRICKNLIDITDQNNICRKVLSECVNRLNEYGNGRDEYIILTLFTFACIINPSKNTQKSKR